MPYLPLHSAICSYPTLITSGLPINCEQVRDNHDVRSTIIHDRAAVHEYSPVILHEHPPFFLHESSVLPHEGRPIITHENYPLMLYDHSLTLHEQPVVHDHSIISNDHQIIMHDHSIVICDHPVVIHENSSISLQDSRSILMNPLTRNITQNNVIAQEQGSDTETRPHINEQQQPKSNKSS